MRESLCDSYCNGKVGFQGKKLTNKINALFNKSTVTIKKNS